MHTKNFLKRRNDMGPMKKQAMKRGGKPVAMKRGGKAKKQVKKKNKKKK